MIFGDFTPDTTLVAQGASMPNSNNWALNVTKIETDVGTSEQADPWYPTLLDSSFPYITLPPEVWSGFESYFRNNGFVSFRSIYDEIRVYESTMSCDKYLRSAPTLKLMMSFDGYDFCVQMGPETYLKNSTSGGCEALVTQADPNYQTSEWSRFGVPFFEQWTI